MKKITLILIPLWFAILMPWGTFTDPDAFYHAHLTFLIAKQGPLTAFPWLDLTTLGTQFADQHFLFHVLTIPAVILAQHATSSPFAEFWAAQIMAVLFASAAAYTLYAVLRRLNPTRAVLFTVCTLLVPGFSIRLLLGKASPLTIALFVATTWGLVTRGRGRRTLLALCGTLFALTHGGWILLVLTACGVLGIDIALRRFGEDASWRAALRQSPWQPALALLGGITMGLLIHPNRNALFSYLSTQLITAAIAPPTGLLQGMEWHAASISGLIATLATLLIPLLLVCIGLLAPQKAQNREHIRTAMLLFAPTALTLALTINSRKFIEYLAPALALLLAALWTLVEEKHGEQRIREWIYFKKTRTIPALLTLTLTLLVIHQIQHTWNALRAPHARTWNTYRQTLNAIAERAQPTDRVFHTSWDEFPTLFAANDTLVYISGLDPAFLYDADPALATEIQKLTLGDTTTTAWNIMTERTQARFVFTTPNRYPAFDAFLQADARFIEIARDEMSAAYEIAQ